MNRIYTPYDPVKAEEIFKSADTFLKHLLTEIDKEIIPRGFEVEHSPEWEAMTDEANERFRFTVKRIQTPYSDAEGNRCWSAPSLREAISIACKSLNLPYRFMI